ncbi:hypothetical protein [Sunxiuqinia elliptica]|uniref:hypothetical protein n=1 Tax=Sunxiuqinia elliptica TaxID=655355 RepID=UPI000B874858|nr:hypothetical protein [Sunxiuqinia elliptica]
MILYAFNHLVTDQSVPLLLEKEEKQQTAFDYYIDGVNSVCVALARQSNLIGQGANDFCGNFG